MALDVGGWNPGRPDGYNHNLVDPFSIVHAAVGALFALARVPAPIAIGAQIAFELTENDLKKVTKDFWPDWTPDGAEQHVGDVLSFTAGYYLARLLKDSRGGGWMLTALAATAAGIWTYNMVESRRLQVRAATARFDR